MNPGVPRQEHSQECLTFLCVGTTRGTASRDVRLRLHEVCWHKGIAGPHLLSQCCEESPDALHRKLQSEPGPCCLGSRMLVSAASHTPAESRDHPSWHYLRVVVDNMWQVRQTMGVAVDLIVAVTAKPPRLITSAPGWQLVKSAKLFPPGVYNRLVVHFNMYVQLAVAAQEYD